MIFPIIVAAFTAVASAVTSIGPAVAGFCANILPKIGPLLSKGLDVLKVVEGIANTISQLMGVFKPDEKAEDIGDRAIQAAEKYVTPDQFETNANYMDFLRSFEPNPKRSENITASEKIISGLSIAGRGLDEKFKQPEGTMANLWLLAATKPEYFDAEKLSQLLKSGPDVLSVMDYFEGKLGGGDSLEVEDALVELDKKIKPDADEKSIREKIYATTKDFR